MSKDEIRAAAERIAELRGGGVVIAIEREITALVQKAREEALEEAGIYVRTHYPVFNHRSSGWEMRADDDAGMIQETYAKAIRTLREKEKA